MHSAVRLSCLTTLAMTAFAANSVLGRLGLVETDIGAGSFALIRLASGAAVLVLLVLIQSKRPAGTWAGGLALLTYAAFFSYAYIAMPAGTGAVILFGVVQITMLGYGLLKGEKLSGLQWLGFVIALAALVWLVSPSLDAPPLLAATSMMLAGIGWGIYSLLGRAAGDPTAATAGNFGRATLLALPILGIALYFAGETAPGWDGVLLAVLSGAVTSGLGYAIWYAALKELSATRAGIAQLTVPAIAAIGGVLFLGEAITLRFTLATLAILGGVALAALTPIAGSRKANG